MTPEQRENEIKQLKRLAIAAWDLNQAMRFAKELIADSHGRSDEPDKRHIRQALESSLIVAYSRPFLQSKGGDATPQISTNLIDVYSREEKVQHEQILHSRNSVVAHSDTEVYSMTIEVTNGLVKRYGTDPFNSTLTGELKQIREMIAKLSNAVYRKQHFLAERVGEGTY